MITDRAPKQTDEKAEHQRSDTMKTLLLPPMEPSRTHAQRMEEALKREDKKAVQVEANAIAKAFAEFYGVPVPKVKILGLRPREVSETSVSELFGDYTFETQVIRLWMRTAVLGKPTAFGTFLSTLCHELCHHLDVVHLDLPNTFHTRGFYERAGRLYHHVRGTPLRPLVWTELSGGRFGIDWARTMKQRVQ